MSDAARAHPRAKPPKVQTAYVVECDEYRKAHKTRQAAEAHVRSIEECGACTLPHRIETRLIRPDTLDLD